MYIDAATGSGTLVNTPLQSHRGRVFKVASDLTAEQGPRVLGLEFVNHLISETLRLSDLPTL